MNVQDLADHVAEAHELSKTDARAIIASIVDAIAAAAKEGDEVALPGFGKFKVRERKAREARNPQTGKTIQVPAQRKLAFLPAKALKDSLNPGAAKTAKPKAAASKESGGKAAAGKSSAKSAGGKAGARA